MDIGQLVGVFYGRLWNRWDDDAVDALLAPDFAFRGSATGKRFTYSGAAFFTAEQGLPTSAWVLGDVSGLRHQLGS